MRSIASRHTLTSLIGSSFLRKPGRWLLRHLPERRASSTSSPYSPGQTRSLGWVRLTEKHDAGWFWLILSWAKGQDEPWYLLSDQPGTAALLRLYRIRMWTEEMYGDLKGHGFDLEATHLDDEDRIARLVLGVCLTFVCLMALGSWVVKKGYRHFVDYRSRRDKSVFRIGWDWLARCLRIGDPIPFRFVPYP